MKLSFLRANFCSELMNYTQKVPVTKGEAYLMGMFSTLNYLVDAPMEEILGEVPISNEIKMALLNQEGPCGALYGLEQGDEVFRGVGNSGKSADLSVF